MWAWLAASGVALALAGGLLIWALGTARRKGEQNARDEAIRDAATVAAGQRDVAARPPAGRRAVLDAMHDGEL